MRTLPDQSSVIYRTGIAARDYDEAIEALQDAKRQPEHLSDGCTICYDSRHTADQCHHNPLVMARRAAKAVRVWRCFHCDKVFTDAEKAQEHFGTRKSDPKCQSDALEAGERKGRIAGLREAAELCSGDSHIEESIRAEADRLEREGGAK